MKTLPNRFLLPLLFLAILALLTALWAGLMPFGWRLPALTPSLAMAHGPLMISGFLGTLITLERAVALRQKWTYIPPLLSGLGWLLTSIKDFYKFNPMFAPAGAADPHSWGPLEAFITKCHEKNLKFMHDLVINHTSIDSPLVEEHRDWYVIKSVVVRKSDGKVVKQCSLDEPANPRHFNEKGYTIEERVAHPCAIDPNDSRMVTIWGDLAEINNKSSPDKENLLKYWLDLVAFYLDKGMDGFRCDAAYQVPPETWKAPAHQPAEG